MRLIDALLLAPWVGAEVGTEGRIFHRIDRDGIPVKTWGSSGSFATARCGVSCRIIGKDGRPLQWGSVRTRGTSWRRCPACGDSHAIVRPEA